MRLFRTSLTFALGIFSLLLAVSAAAQTVVATIPLPAQPGPANFALPQEIAIDETSNLVYATVSFRQHPGPGLVAVIDGATDTLLGTIPLSSSPWGIGFNPATGKLYVAHPGGGGVAVIDTTTATVTATINPGQRVSGIAIDVANNLVYATQEISFNLWLIDGATDSHVATFNLGVFRPALLTLDAARNRLYIGNNAGGPVIIFDTATNTVVGSLPAGLQRPTLDLVNDRIYFVDTFGEFLAVYDRSTETLIANVPIDPSPLPSDPLFGLAYNPETNRIFISRFGSATVIVLDAASLSPVAVLPGGNYGFAINSATDKVYVAERGSSGGGPGLPGRIHVISDPPVIDVAIDVKPGSDPNSINPSSKGVVPVAILATDVFDAGDVDPLTVELGPAGARTEHATGHTEDVDGDGDLDLVLHFRVRDTGIACGDTSMALVGETLAGVMIAGADVIRTVGCRSQ